MGFWKLLLIIAKEKKTCDHKESRDTFSYIRYLKWNIYWNYFFTVLITNFRIEITVTWTSGCTEFFPPATSFKPQSMQQHWHLILIFTYKSISLPTVAFPFESFLLANRPIIHGWRRNKRNSHIVTVYTKEYL